MGLMGNRKFSRGSLISPQISAALRRKPDSVRKLGQLVPISKGSADPLEASWGLGVVRSVLRSGVYS